jgi:hypothetical protein
MMPCYWKRFELLKHSQNPKLTATLKRGNYCIMPPPLTNNVLMPLYQQTAQTVGTLMPSGQQTAQAITQYTPVDGHSSPSSKAASKLEFPVKGPALLPCCQHAITAHVQQFHPELIAGHPSPNSDYGKLNGTASTPGLNVIT